MPFPQRLLSAARAAASAHHEVKLTRRIPLENHASVRLLAHALPSFDVARRFEARRARAVRLVMASLFATMV